MSEWPRDPCVRCLCDRCVAAPDAERLRDLLSRILASSEDGTIDIPDVARAIEAEIREVLGA